MNIASGFLSLAVKFFDAANQGHCHSVNRELKQQRRRRLRKRHLKSEFAPLQTLSRLFHLVYFVKCWQMFLELNSKRLYQSSGKEKESFCLVFPSTRKRERYDCAVTAKKCKKSVTHVQSCCFANLNLLLFYRSLCRRRRRCLSSLISPPRTWE